MKKRYCVREKVKNYAGFSYSVKLWIYHYNDGTIETVTVRIKNK